MESLEIAARSRSPLVLPRMNGGDRVTRSHGPWLERLLVTGRSAVRLRIRPDGAAGRRGSLEAGSRFVLSATPVDPARLTGPGVDRLAAPDESDLREGIARLSHAFGLDDDLAGFRDACRDDPRLGPAIRRRLPHRPLRRADPWEALLWAITEQLIEYRRAAAIQRRMIRKWGIRLGGDGPVGDRHGGLVSVPSPEAISGVAPAELQACDLGARRAIATVRVASEVAAGRIDPRDPADDRRLLAIPDIGPWTVACLALRGRGEPDALLAGDLAQVKLVGHLTGLGRLAEVSEVEAFYESYAPYRGIAGELMVAEYGKAVHGPGNRARIRQNLRRAA